MNSITEAIYAPKQHFLIHLAQGWKLPFVAEPMMGGHGRYSILLTKRA